MQLKTSIPIAKPTLELEQALQKLLARKDLGYLGLSSDKNIPQESITWAKKLKSSGVKQVAVVGMGGSYLGAMAIHSAIGKNLTSLVFFNSSDPDSYTKSMDALENIQTSHFLIISKSGQTVETLMLTNHIAKVLQQHKIALNQAVTVITEDNPSPLFNFAKKNDIPVFYHPKNVGGRFSVFSVVGQMPLAFAGVDLNKLLLGADSLFKNPKDVLNFCTEVQASFQRQEWITVFWPYKDSLLHWCDWALQLWAESLGKKQNRNGDPAPRVSTPTYCIGSISQHSILQNILEGAKDKLVIFLGEEKTQNEEHTDNHFSEVNWLTHSMASIFQSQRQCTRESLIQSKVSNIEILVPKLDEENLGKLMAWLQLSIGVLGEALNIDAYNQPAVEIGKNLLQNKMRSKK
jgi:glucose-6-phosphate isomerase